MSGTLIGPNVLSPAPILEAAQRYGGTIVDLDASCVLGPDEFAKAREALTRWLAGNGLSAGDRVILAIGQRSVVRGRLDGDFGVRRIASAGASYTPPAELLRYARRFGARFLAGEPEDGSGRAEIETTLSHWSFANVPPLDWCTLAIGDHGSAGTGAARRAAASDVGLDRLAKNRAATRLRGDRRGSALCGDNDDRRRRRDHGDSADEPRLRIW